MMTAGDFTITIDKTGFPLIQLKEWDFQIGLMPVSKYQFERFLSSGDKGANTFTDEWYRNKLHQNPRVRFDDWSDAPWRLFLSGLSLEDIGRFLSYLGKDYRFPRVEEFCAFYHARQRIAEFHEQIMNDTATIGCSCQVRHWIEHRMCPLINQQEGLPEYASKDKEIYCIGSPWSTYHGNCWDPESIRPLTDDIQVKMGFRVAKSIK